VPCQDLGIERGGSRDGRALLHAARQLMRQEPLDLAQADRRELQANHDLDDRIGQRRQFAQRQGDVLLDRE
jgi:hypothetical protein